MVSQFKADMDAGKLRLISTTKKERKQIKAALEKARKLKKIKK